MNYDDKRELNREPKQSINSYPAHLRGLPQNRWGGHRTQRQRGFPRWSRGAAGPVRRYTKEECRVFELDLKRRGLI